MEIGSHQISLTNDNLLTNALINCQWRPRGSHVDTALSAGDPGLAPGYPELCSGTLKRRSEISFIRRAEPGAPTEGATISHNKTRRLYKCPITCEILIKNDHSQFLICLFSLVFTPFCMNTRRHSVDEGGGMPNNRKCCLLIYFSPVPTFIYRLNYLLFNWQINRYRRIDLFSIVLIRQRFAFDGRIFVVVEIFRDFFPRRLFA